MKMASRTIGVQRSRLLGFVQLTRPANVVTAHSDILAGYAISGAWMESGGSALWWLLLATTGLYAGGVVLNDAFDRELDARERPERPIPSGLISKNEAFGFGALLLITGIIAAWQVSWISAALAIGIAICAVFYDSIGKHHPVAGPLNMGACRSGNLLLGISALPAALTEWWFLGFIPLLFIAAVTMISRGEVHGGKRSTGYVALFLTGVVIIFVCTLTLSGDFQLIIAAPFLLLYAGWIGPPFMRSILDPEPGTIRRAVKAGVLSLILLNAALAAGFAGWVFGLITVALLPLSIGLARLFAVT